MFQAITTKYIGPSNTRGSRIKATAAAGSVTIEYDDGLNSAANHSKAAEALAVKYGWRGNWLMGGMPEGTGYCFVCSSGESAFTTWAA